MCTARKKLIQLCYSEEHHSVSAYVILNAQGNNMESITAYYKEIECVDT
jgi:hypothetical protein